MNRRTWVKSAAIATVGSGFGLGYYAWRIEPHWIESTELNMPLRNLPASWQGKRLVQVSDLHVGNEVDFAYLSHAMGRVRDLQPDAIAITGDFMTCVADEWIGRVIELVRQLNIDRQPLLTVLGNHDYGASLRMGNGPDSTATRMHDALKTIGVHALRNESVELDGLLFAGTDDWWSRNTSFQSTFANVDPTRGSVLLNHNPDAVDAPHGTLKQHNGWILCGHTHGGQCWFPQLGAPIVPIRNRAYTAGQIELSERTTMYVNRGLGYKKRVRFLCAPEITVFRMLNQSGEIAV